MLTNLLEGTIVIVTFPLLVRRDTRAITGECCFSTTLILAEVRKHPRQSWVPPSRQRDQVGTKAVMTAKWHSCRLQGAVFQSQQNNEINQPSEVLPRINKREGSPNDWKGNLPSAPNLCWQMSHEYQIVRLKVGTIEWRTDRAIGCSFLWRLQHPR